MSSPSAPPSEKLPDEIESAGAPDAPRGRAPLVSIDLTEGGPPPELLDQMARADEINMRLRRSGREICFALSHHGTVPVDLFVTNPPAHALLRRSRLAAVDASSAPYVLFRSRAPPLA